MAHSFIISRNATGRSTLMHLIELPGYITRCGIDTSGWSKAYMPQPITATRWPKCGRSR